MRREHKKFWKTIEGFLFCRVPVYNSVNKSLLMTSYDFSLDYRIKIHSHPLRGRAEARLVDMKISGKKGQGR
jgi:hypothetical protein